MGNSNNSARFIAFGRVISGTIKSGEECRIMGPNYEPKVTNDNQQQSNCKSVKNSSEDVLKKMKHELL